MNFSSRTSWHREPNRLSQLLEARKRSGNAVLDLTVSNPTECGFEYPEQEILSALSDSQSLHYQPNPHGLLSAREAVAQYYRDKKNDTDPSNIFLTSSTSEAYSLIFKLLCNIGDEVLIPQPSYPLFDYLAQINDVKTCPYRLQYDHGWVMDFDSVRNAITKLTKAIVLVHPHNPTGMFLRQSDLQQLNELAHKHNLALIVDEVFSEYGFDKDVTKIPSTANNNGALTFTLNGISKLLGLPQMKFGWTVVSGEKKIVGEACERLEILCDTFLSVNTPVQIALPKLLNSCQTMRQQILERVKSNYSFLQSNAHPTSHISYLLCEGGWYAILRVPRTRTDEEWAIQLLEHEGVYVHPGYFFDLEEGFLVVSLLTNEEVFREAIQATAKYIAAAS